MPNAVQADWGLIQQLYIQGFTPKVIADKTGVKADTVSIRAHRGKWKELAARAIEAVKGQVPQATEVQTATESALASSSERVRERLARLVERSVAKLEELDIRTPSHALAVNGELEPVMRNAKVLYGWGEALAQPAIRIQVVAQCRLASEPAGYVPSGDQGLGQGKHSFAGGAEGGEAGPIPLSAPMAQVNMPPHNFPTFENVPHGTGPVLDVASEVVRPAVVEDYSI